MLVTSQSLDITDGTLSKLQYVSGCASQHFQKTSVYVQPISLIVPYSVTTLQIGQAIS
jgi:hypothetical protein